MVVPLVLAAAQLISSSQVRRDYAAGDKDAFLMMPPETVCGGQVEEMVWTGDGSHLVIRRQAQNVTATDLASFGSGTKPTPEEMAHMAPHEQLLVWSVKSHKLQTVLDLSDGGKTSIGEINPMPGSDRVFLSTGTTVSDPAKGPHMVASFAVLDTKNGSLTPMDSYDPDGKVDLMMQVSPVASVGLIEAVDHSKPTWTVRFFGPSGTPGTTVEVPAKSYVGFNDSGTAGYTFIEVVNKKRVAKYQTVDPATGKLGAILTAKEAPGKAQAPILRTWERTMGDEVAAPTVFLSVVGGKADESGIVTTDGSRAVVSPKLDAVAYVGQGSAMVRTMARVPREAFEKARQAAERTVALSNAKQVGLGLIMYSSDMDDKLPGQDADLRSLIGPYLKNDKLFDGFTYTFKGGAMTDVEKPAETELGSVAGPGGRAVVYVDGHAKWISDK